MGDFVLKLNFQMHLSLHHLMEDYDVLATLLEAFINSISPSDIPAFLSSASLRGSLTKDLRKSFSHSYQIPSEVVQLLLEFS